ncbi:MAG: nucleotidyltransferase domain-containing protein [Polyangiaceae bacterium]|nr:nucleotidyltransferase domain-containing protein [Polyangiaceae bacterium]
MSDTDDRCHPLHASERLWHERYPSALAVFCAGSVIRGEAFASSDLDVVVLFRQLPNAWRESFHFLGWPVEVFPHDPETLAYFVRDDCKGGVPSLASMLAEALIVPGSSPRADRVQTWARAIVDSAPPRPSLAALDQERYGITDLLNDFRDNRARPELLAIACKLYLQVSNFCLKSRGHWLGSPKRLPRSLRHVSPELSAAVENGFEIFFKTGLRNEAINAVQLALEPFGGELFDSFRSDAPGDWRLPTTDIPWANGL